LYFVGNTHFITWSILNWFGCVVKFFFSIENEGNFDQEKDENPMEFNEKKRQKLGSGIQESFLHPKAFKIEKMTLPKKTEQPKKQTKQPVKKEAKTLQHRFNII
jgi:hypothetical protein